MKKRYLITYSFKGDERNKKVDSFTTLLTELRLNFTTEQEDQSTYFGNSSTTSKGQFDEERKHISDKLRQFANKHLDRDDFIHFYYPEKQGEIAELYKIIIKKEEPYSF